MKKLFVVAVLLVVLALPVASAQALVACPYPHLSCRGVGGIVCVDKHGHIHRFRGVVHRGWHCIAI